MRALPIAALLLALPARAAEPLFATTPVPGAATTELVLGLSTVTEDGPAGHRSGRVLSGYTAGTRFGLSDRLELEARLDRRVVELGVELRLERRRDIGHGRPGQVWPPPATATASPEPVPGVKAYPAAPPPAPALAVRPPRSAPIALRRPAELRDLIPGDDPLHRRAADAAERKQGAVAFAAVASVAGALVLPLLMYDLLEFTASGESRRVPRFVVPLAVSVGSGGVFLGLNASANREARAVAEAWNAAHPERPIDWRP